MTCVCPATILCIFGAILLSIKIYMKCIIGIYKGTERLDGKTIIVTGANAGIGLISAKDFANRGARVVMCCRDMLKAEKVKAEIIKETKNSNISLKHVNFASLKSVRQCAREILAEEQRIDVLLNNAGAASIGTKTTDDDLNLLMQINYFAPFLFTNILLEKIKKSGPSRIVNVSSIMHNIGRINLEKFKNPQEKNLEILYGSTKLALIYFSNELARKLEGTGVTVNSLHPGTFPSEIVRYTSSIIYVLWNYVLALFFRTTEEGAQTSIYCCVSPDVSKLSGKYFQECKLSKPSRKASDMAMAKKVWDLSEDAVNLQANEKHY